LKLFKYSDICSEVNSKNYNHKEVKKLILQSIIYATTSKILEFIARQDTRIRKFKNRGNQAKEEFRRTLVKRPWSSLGN
jgi:hypothetical protein